MEKAKSVFAAFVLGGCMGVITHLFMLLFGKWQWNSPAMVLVLAMGSMIVVSFILYLAGWYPQWEAIAGMGAKIPISGLLAGVAGGVIAASKNGLTMGKAAQAGMWPVVKLLLMGLAGALMIAVSEFLITYLIAS
ncbi:MAG: SpoVA/SpoVAEb family sporulation membrane protein [Peptococcaceae bacterium]|nr:SpoVA/SpoVAEb family sporulation membrane protein [Peptococcaceae bacterium]